MISPRHGCAILVVAACVLSPAMAQEGTGTTVPKTGASSAFGSPQPSGSGIAPPPGSSAPGGSSAFGAPAPETPAVPGAGPTLPGITKPDTSRGTGSGTGTGTGTGSRLRPGTGPGTNPTGASSAFGENGTGEKPTTTGSEPTYTIPGAYGKPGQQFTAGEGRLARPRFRYTGSVSFGYDDNVFQSPSNSEGSPDVVVRVLDRPATPERVEAGIGPDGGVATVTVPGTAATTRRVVIPGVAGAKRVGSFLTRANVGFDVQFASRKTLFTFDLRTGGDWYWDRPGKDVDYTGSLALMYLRRLTPRLQFTASGNASYQTQPDLTQVNTSTRQTGALLNLGSKLDLTYRISPRLSTVGSVSYAGLRYQETTEQSGDYDSFTLGGEVRYLFSPRLTFLGEVRYSSIGYTGATTRDSHTLFALLGGELSLSRRFTATLRIGAAQRTFDESGTSATSPYGETTISYRLAKATVIQFNGRFGFEEPPDALSKLISLRAGLSLSQSFSPRLRGTLGSNVVRQTTTRESTNTESITNTVDSLIGFEYTLDRHWTLNANYSYVRGFGSVSATDYYRNRIFVGAEYDF